MRQFISSYLRPWATPIVIGVFILMSVTGLLMFFHMSIGLNKLAHEWFGLIFIFGAVIHVVVNYLSFTKYFKKPLAVSLILISLIFLGLSFLSFKQVSSNQVKIVMEKVVKTPMVNLALISGKSEEQLMNDIKNKGFNVNDIKIDTIETLSGKDKSRRKELLDIIFLDSKN